jgi:hypothetical protein
VTRSRAVERDARGLIPSSKVATVFDLVTRDGGATTAEIQVAAGTKNIRQTCNQLAKTVPGFTFEAERDGKEFRWRGAVAGQGQPKRRQEGD